MEAHAAPRHIVQDCCCTSRALVDVHSIMLHLRAFQFSAVHRSSNGLSVVSDPADPGCPERL